MLVVIPYHSEDEKLAFRMLEWMSKLDACPKKYSALIVTSCQDSNPAILQVASSYFKSVEELRYPVGRWTGWPMGTNLAFRTAARHIARTGKKSHWLWLEPDCVPLCRDWLDLINNEYHSHGKPFAGHIVGKYMAGCGVYPGDIRKFSQNAFLCSGAPFDVAMGPEIVRKAAAINHLIHHEVTDNPKPFKSQDDVDARIPPSACLFHKCKDGSLYSVILEKKPSGTGRLGKLKLISSEVKQSIYDRTSRSASSYYHSGNLGDVIYSLSAIRARGGGSLVIGPVQNGTSPCSNPISKQQFDLLKPIVELQEYIKSVRFSEVYPGSKVKYDLNEFRNHWNDWALRGRTGINNLCKMHYYTVGAINRWSDLTTWIRRITPIETGRIIVHRSSRYHSDDFPWADLMERYSEKCMFVGLPEEHSEFESRFGKVSFYKVRDFVDMAGIILGGCAFVGNQSFPCSLAIGMGQKVWQESWKPSEDCIFDRPRTFMNQRSGIDEFSIWVK